MRAARRARTDQRMKSGERVAADDRRGVDLQAAEQVGDAAVGFEARALHGGMPRSGNQRPVSKKVISCRRRRCP
jgi:hypothetical protein